ncbi:MAG: hypothetical protein LBJ93_01625 [Clostridiales bacterium]|jgi:hypothetical protein|nr:hypothetical protein [Clostridiales bacterium]
MQFAMNVFLFPGEYWSLYERLVSFYEYLCGCPLQIQRIEDPAFKERNEDLEEFRSEAEESLKLLQAGERYVFECKAIYPNEEEWKKEFECHFFTFYGPTHLSIIDMIPLIKRNLENIGNSEVNTLIHHLEKISFSGNKRKMEMSLKVIYDLIKEKKDLQQMKVSLSDVVRYAYSISDKEYDERINADRERYLEK